MTKRQRLERCSYKTFKGRAFGIVARPTVSSEQRWILMIAEGFRGITRLRGGEREFRADPPRRSIFGAFWASLSVNSDDLSNKQSNEQATMLRQRGHPQSVVKHQTLRKATKSLRDLSEYEPIALCSSNARSGRTQGYNSMNNDSTTRKDGVKMSSWNIQVCMSSKYVHPKPQYVHLGAFTEGE